MNFISKLLNSRPDIQEAFEAINSSPSSLNLIQPSFSHNVVSYSLGDEYSPSNPVELMALATDPLGGTQQLIYLTQLASDKIASVQGSNIEIAWLNLYKLLADVEHEDSLYLLALPGVDKSVPVLGEVGTVSDKFFRLRIDGWKEVSKPGIKLRKYVGGAFVDGSTTALQTKEVWQLIDFISHNHGFEDKVRKQSQNESLWGEARRLALSAKADLSPYLSSTVVLVLSLLKLRYIKAQALGTTVVTIEPYFDGAPEDWIPKFDSFSFIPEHSDFSMPIGRTRVIFPEAVRDVLTVIKTQFDGRKVAGSKAEAFLRNPFSYLGEAAAKVLDENQIEEAKKDAGIFTTRISLRPDIAGGSIESVTATIYQTIGNGMAKADRCLISSAHELDILIKEIDLAFSEDRQFFSWRNFIIDVDGALYQTSESAKSWLNVWKDQAKNFIDFNYIYALDNYTDRVEGIGIAKPIYSAYITIAGGDITSWDPKPLISVSLVPGSPPIYIAVDAAWVREFEIKIDQAKASGIDKIVDSMLPIPLSTAEATDLVKVLNTIFSIVEPVIIQEPPTIPPPQLLPVESHLKLRQGVQVI